MKEYPNVIKVESLRLILEAESLLSVLVDQHGGEKQKKRNAAHKGVFRGEGSKTVKERGNEIEEKTFVIVWTNHK